METDFIKALTTLKIVSEEEAKNDYKYFDSVDEYDDPVEVARLIPEGTYTVSGDLCIYWATREPIKTEYVNRIYRTGESKWIYVFNMQFLD